MSQKETLPHVMQRLEKVRAQRNLLLGICQKFVARVEAGQVRSTVTYGEMKAAIALCKKEGEL